MSLSPDGNLILGVRDNKGAFGNGNKLYFCGTDFNSDPTEIYRYAVSNDVTQLRIRIGDGLSNSDKFIVGTSGNSAGDWTSSMVVTAAGRVGIKNDNPEFELDVDGIVRAEEIIVEDIAANNMNLAGDLAANNITLTTNGQTADFVFESDYNLRNLSEVENFIKINKHLPDIPSAKQMEASGVNLAEMNKLLLQKVEELTLYAIEKDKEVQGLKSDVAEIKAMLIGSAQTK